MPPAEIVPIDPNILEIMKQFATNGHKMLPEAQVAMAKAIELLIYPKMVIKGASNNAAE